MRIFLSYHTPDAATAKRLRAAIVEREPSAEVFFAPYSMRPGAYWLPQLGEGIAKADAFLLLVGKTLGPWQLVEYYEAFDRHVKEPGFPLAPVFIDQNAQGIPFLHLIHWLNAPDPTAEPHLSAIVAAIKGETALEAAPDPWRAINPYRGLEALREQDAEFFFGREEKTAEILSIIAQNKHKLLALVGNSGVGKSSLMQAGVIGALRRQRLPGGGAWPEALGDARAWAMLSLRPGDNALRALASAFTNLWFEDPTDPKRQQRADEWERRLRTAGSLPELIDVTVEQLTRQSIDPPKRILLYVDQGEELYARNTIETVSRFSELLAGGLADERLVALLSQRSNYYGQLQANKFLFPVTETIDLPPLSNEALKDVLRKPAAVLRARFEPEDLVDFIVEGAGDAPGALPLLADYVTELWSHMQTRQDGVIRLAEKKEIVQVGAALSSRADQFLSQHMEDEKTIKRLFTLKLALVQEEGEPVRRRAWRSKVTDDEWRLMEALADAKWRLLVTGEDEGACYAEVAHEVLLTEWNRLRHWLEDARQFLVFKARLEHAYKEWKSTGNGRKSDALLMGRPLTQAENWLKDREGDIEADEAAFIRLSIARRDHLDRIRKWVRISIPTVLTAACAALAYLSYYAFDQKAYAMKALSASVGSTLKTLSLTNKYIDNGDISSVQADELLGATDAKSFYTVAREPEVKRLIISILLPRSDINSTLSKTQQALDDALKAKELAFQLTAKNPENEKYQQLLYSASFRVGDNLSPLGKHDEGLNEFQFTMNIITKQLKTTTDKHKWNKYKSNIMNKTGDLLMQAAKYNDAENRYFESLRLSETALKQDASNGEWLWHRATALARLGDLYLTQSELETPDVRKERLAKALESHQTALDIRKALAAQSLDDNSLQSNIARSHNQLGHTLAKSGRLKDAYEQHFFALEIRQKLYNKDNTNAERIDHLANANMFLGKLLIDVSDREGAQKHYSVAKTFWLDLDGRKLEKSSWKRKLAETNSALGDLLAASDRRNEALAHYRDALSALRAARRLAPPTSTMSWKLRFFVAREKLRNIQPSPDAPAG